MRLKKYSLIIGLILLAVIIGGCAEQQAEELKGLPQADSENSQGRERAVQPIQEEKSSGDSNKKKIEYMDDRNKKCRGTKIKFDFAPVNLEKTKAMLPLGLMVGSHVTPIDHHYFQNFGNDKFDIEIYSPGSGYITG